ncbi:3-phenylpropionate/trans-cinnamate dioxygenase ferredoxin reductase subunit [Albimonas donghaensis]|uniref:3-phenylpropionate/trans-cinnamate dioxygenase ferredoxin reductase subunit n=1 Tax=Albimonas donghaensis TaxID=356660 RepID=A0A1H2SRB7_9RHOB|nr:FAD-dependent oxidoreductase [Albimonas donghaensis]SDW34152.1 3-phenylpropionate/trans-cinnamate dioxygenase ferredoxin reductase subunit [Albimonas donghaensis]
MAGMVILGAGQAGASLAAALRAKGYDGPVTLVGDEPAAPYQRPPLSKKYLLGEMARDRLLLRPEAFYAEHDIALRTGLKAASIDRAAKTVRFQDGETLAYDKLALTTGARPRALPEALGGALPGVFAVRSLADVDAMAPEFVEGRRLLVVGGGYIGLEAAAVAVSLGLRVTLIEAAPRILGRVACAETAGWFAALHRARGVDLREGVGLTRLEPGPDGRVARAVLAEGAPLDVDFVLVGIGVQANAELAEAAGLALAPSGGIEVDAACRTADPSIFAAGDCASLPWRGARIRLESVQNAIEQGEAAAASMLDEPVDYDPMPWFWSDQFDVKLQIAGLARDWDRIVTRPGTRAGALSHWYFRGAELIAVDAMNDPRGYMTGKRWLEAGRSPDPDALADPGADLKTL